jgi:hypothetical protein
MTGPAQDDYGRGVEAGGILERLKGHDEHFNKINGHLADLALEMRELTAAVTSRDATAAGAKEADQERRDQVETKWARIVRLVGLVGWLVAVIAIVGLIVVLTQK